MRHTPAQAHRQRKLASLASAAAEPGSELTGSAYQLMQAQLADHRRSLKKIQSIERKIDAKRSFLPDYDAWVNGALATGTGGHDLVLTTVMVWHIDAGNYARALEIAAYAIKHSLPLPDQYDRNLGTVLIDEIGGAALAGKIPLPEALRILPGVLYLTKDLDAPDQARAKMYKAFGWALIGKTGPADIDYDAVLQPAAVQALEHLQRALSLWEQVGCKKDIERLERRLKKLDEPSAPILSPDPGPSAAQAETEGPQPDVEARSPPTLQAIEAPGQPGDEVDVALSGAGGEAVARSDLTLP